MHIICTFHFSLEEENLQRRTILAEVHSAEPRVAMAYQPDLKKGGYGGEEVMLVSVDDRSDQKVRESSTTLGHER